MKKVKQIKGKFLCTPEVLQSKVRITIIIKPKWVKLKPQPKPEYETICANINPNLYRNIFTYMKTDNFTIIVCKQLMISEFPYKRLF